VPIFISYILFHWIIFNDILNDYAGFQI